MKRITRRVLTVAGSLTLAMGTLAVVAPSASAVGYNGACGSGYNVIRTLQFGPTPIGTVYLTYNSSNGYNCVVTMLNKSINSSALMDAWISTDGTGEERDTGNYSSYAGPVYKKAVNTCVNWGGSIGYDSLSEYGVACG
jgi:hypothetical protein